MRFLYWALLDGSINTSSVSVELGNDIWLLMILLPLYWAGMHFLFSPIDTLYSGQMQAICAPLSLLGLFYFNS